MDIMSFSKSRRDRQVELTNELANELRHHGISVEDLYKGETMDSDNLEFVLRTTPWILDKVRSNNTYAQNLYAALCNNSFQKLDVVLILKNKTWSCSWRSAGGIIADMKQEGDYIDWYCSGIGSEDSTYGDVREGIVTSEINKDLNTLGWAVIRDSDI